MFNFLLQLDDEGYADESLEIAFLSSDNETPVYLISFGFPIIINSYSDAAPPSSKFTLPNDCMMAKSAKAKSEKVKGKAPFRGYDIFTNLKKHI